MTRQTVIMAGPLPPAVGGMASVLGALAMSTLAMRVDLLLFETGKTTPADRSLWAGLAARLKLMRDWWRLFGCKPAPVGHIHTCSGFTFFLDAGLLLLSRLRGAGVVLHVHGARFDAFLDGLSPPLALLAAWIARRAHAVVVLSPEWRDRLATRWPGAHLVVVANGVPVAKPAAALAAPGPARFLFLGNLGRRKGVHVLLQAASLSREPWHLDLAGGVEEPGIENWAQQQIAQHNLGGRVRLLGPVVGDAKLQLMASSQGFVLPSLAEGLPMAMLEAMAASLPVVVSDVGAMPEAARHGVDGIVVPAGDPQALADALDTLSADPDLRCRMGRSGAERCQSRYGIERMADALLGIYASLPAGRG
jgi:glycosyltransferase involved in cell wall biosynthesis